MWFCQLWGSLGMPFSRLARICHVQCTKEKPMESSRIKTPVLAISIQLDRQAYRCETARRQHEATHNKMINYCQVGGNCIQTRAQALRGEGEDFSWQKLAKKASGSGKIGRNVEERAYIKIRWWEQVRWFQRIVRSQPMCIML